MVAPLLPRLSAVSVQSMGLVVPAYLIPYGISTLFYGLLSALGMFSAVQLAATLAAIPLFRTETRAGGAAG